MFSIIRTSVSVFIENKYSENFSLDGLFYYDYHISFNYKEILFIFSTVMIIILFSYFLITIKFKHNIYIYMYA